VEEITQSRKETVQKLMEGAEFQKKSSKKKDNVVSPYRGWRASMVSGFAIKDYAPAH